MAYSEDQTTTQTRKGEGNVEEKKDTAQYQWNLENAYKGKTRDTTCHPIGSCSSQLLLVNRSCAEEIRICLVPYGASHETRNTNDVLCFAITIGQYGGTIAALGFGNPHTKAVETGYRRCHLSNEKEQTFWILCDHKSGLVALGTGSQPTPSSVLLTSRVNGELKSRLTELTGITVSNWRKPVTVTVNVATKRVGVLQSLHNFIDILNADDDHNLELFAKFKKCAPTSTHKYHLRSYPNTFVGKDAVDVLVSTDLAESRLQAVNLGNRLLKSGYIYHVKNQHFFEDGYIFYRYREDICSPQTQNSDQNKQKQLIELLDLFQSECQDIPTKPGDSFLGKDAVVAVMNAGIFCDEETASEQFDCLLHHGYITANSGNQQEVFGRNKFYQYSNQKFILPRPAHVSDKFDNGLTIFETRSKDGKQIKLKGNVLFYGCDSFELHQALEFEIDGSVHSLVVENEYIPFQYLNDDVLFFSQEICKSIISVPGTSFMAFASRHANLMITQFSKAATKYILHELSIKHVLHGSLESLFSDTFIPWFEMEELARDTQQLQNSFVKKGCSMCRSLFRLAWTYPQNAKGRLAPVVFYLLFTFERSIREKNIATISSRQRENLCATRQSLNVFSIMDELVQSIVNDHIWNPDFRGLVGQEDLNRLYKVHINRDCNYKIKGNNWSNIHCWPGHQNDRLTPYIGDHITIVMLAAIMDRHETFAALQQFGMHTVTSYNGKTLSDMAGPKVCALLNGNRIQSTMSVSNMEYKKSNQRSSPPANNHVPLSAGNKPVSDMEYRESNRPSSPPVNNHVPLSAGDKPVADIIDTAVEVLAFVTAPSTREAVEFVTAPSSREAMRDVIESVVDIAEIVPVVGSICKIIHGIANLAIKAKANMSECKKIAQRCESIEDPLKRCEALFKKNGRCSNAKYHALGMLQSELTNMQTEIEIYSNKGRLGQTFSSNAFQNKCKNFDGNVRKCMEDLQVGLNIEILGQGTTIIEQNKEICTQNKKQGEKLDTIVQVMREDKRLRDSQESAKMLKEQVLDQNELQKDEVDFEGRDASSRLGSGGYSQVYGVKYVGKSMACKVISLIGSRKEKQQTQKNFETELANMCQVRHPHVIHAYGGVFNTGTEELWLIMEKAEDDLRNLLDGETELQTKDRVKIASDVAQALKFLHSRDVHHCDMKSSNILISREMGVLHAKVADFGSSHSKASVTSAPKFSSSIGTANWSSPEYLKGGPFTDKSDVYSLGVVLWELLTLQTPWEGLSENQIISALDLNKTLEVPEKDNVEQELYGLRKAVLLCLNYQPSKRPTASQVCDLLQ